MAASTNKGKVIASSTTGAIGPDGFLDIRPTKNRVHLKRPDDSRSRGPLPQASSSETSSNIPVSTSDREATIQRVQPASSASSSVEDSPATILQGLMDRFITLKDNGGRAEAFKALQKSFASNAAVLSPYFIPLKDLMNLIMELETFIGKSGENKGKSPEQIIRGFLQSGLVDDIKIPSPYPDIIEETIDNGHETVSTMSKEG